MTTNFVTDTAPDPSDTPANSTPIREAMKAARQHPYDVEEDGYTTGPVAAWRLLDYNAAADVAARIRDEAYNLGESAGFHKGQIHGYDAAQEEGLKLIAAERSNYGGAMADLAALVDVARKAVARVKIAGGGASGVEFAIEPLERFLDSNHPVDSDRPKPAMHIIRRADGGEVHDQWAFMTCDGPDDWQVADDNEHELYDEEVDYQILACRVVNTRTFGVTEDEDEDDDESAEVTA